MYVCMYAFSVCLHACICVYLYHCACVGVKGQLGGSQFFPSTVWDLRIELGWLGLAASSFTHWTILQAHYGIFKHILFLLILLPSLLPHQLPLSLVPFHLSGFFFTCMPHGSYFPLPFLNSSFLSLVVSFLVSWPIPTLISIYTNIKS